MAKRNANLNNVRIDFVHADAFTWIRQMQKNGRTWDLVLCDPPKFVDSRDEEFEAEGLRKYNDLNVLAMQLVAPGGLFVTCSCSGLVLRRSLRGPRQQGRPSLPEAPADLRPHRPGRRPPQRLQPPRGTLPQGALEPDRVNGGRWTDAIR
jgi:hypothetical protein